MAYRDLQALFANIIRVGVTPPDLYKFDFYQHTP